MSERKDDLQKMDVDREEAAKAAAAIRAAFIWDHTAEGGEYWFRIVKRLSELARPTPAQTNKGEG